MTVSKMELSETVTKVVMVLHFLFVAMVSCRVVMKLVIADLATTEVPDIVILHVQV